MYAHRSTLGLVELAFTDRRGGVGAAPDFAPDDELIALRQVHGAVVVDADEARDGPPEADGVVATAAGVVLMVRVADCVPVLLADPVAGVVAAAHAGRLGMVLGVVPATVKRMREAGAADITAWVGPHICGACYEVPAKMRDEAAAALPAAAATTSWGTPALDIGAGVGAQLAADGVRVVAAGRCTLESADLFSYRREGAAAGRQAGLIRLGAVR